MKKNILMTLLVVLVAGCGNSISEQKPAQQIEEKLSNENKPLINVEEKTKQAEQILKKIGLTGEKLKQELARQKAGWEIIAKLKGDARKKYIIETQILPKIIKSGKVSKKCTTTNLDDYVACLYVSKIPIENLLDQVPKQVQDTVKKSYYNKIYSLDKKKLLQATDDPIAIKVKKIKLQEMFREGLISNPSVCNKLPEEQIRQYCKALFEQK